MKKQFYTLSAFLLMALLISSCAPGAEKFTEETAGFLMGLWHGFISLFTFIASLFMDGVEVYEKNNIISCLIASCLASLSGEGKLAESANYRLC